MALSFHSFMFELVFSPILVAIGCREGGKEKHGRREAGRDGTRKRWNEEERERGVRK